MGDDEPGRIAELETAAFTAADWTASWLSVPSGVTIRCEIPRHDRVRRSWLMLAAQGLVRAEIDGHVINESHLDPTRTDTIRALYRCYDVSDLVADGHILDLTIGTGEWARTGEQPRVLAELVIEGADGGLIRVCPDERSTMLRSEITIDEPFYRERHEPGGAGAKLSRHPERVQDAPPSFPLPRDVTPDSTPPIRRVQTLPLRQIARDNEKTRVFDAGTNVSGRARLILATPLPEGLLIRVAHGEHLGADGRLDTSNLSMPHDRDRPRQVLEWVSDGITTQIEPWFAYYGFRYVEVVGLPNAIQVRADADVVHSDVQPSGQIRTDSDIISTLLSRTERTFLNNLHGVPEDCPTREQAAWTGDAASVSEYAFAAFSVESFLRKWTEDLVTSMRPSGELPAVAPDVRAERFRGDPVWGAALHRTLYGHWLHYGDADVVLHALPALRRWADFQRACRDEMGIVSHAPVSHGQDWLALEQTPAPLLHTAATIDCLDTLAKLEDSLASPAEARRRMVQAEELRIAARRVFVDTDRGIVANGSQGSYAVAIESGILDADMASSAIQRIVSDIHRRGARVSGGFGTIRSIVRALSQGGEHQTVFDVLSQPDEPGVGAMLSTGPGTLWESWWVDPTNAGTGSLNHVGLGGPFASWVWEGLLGLRPTAPGYRSFELAPQIVEGVRHLEVTTSLPHGRLAITMSTAAGVMEVTMTVPGGTSGVLRLPGQGAVPLRAGTHRHTAPLPAADLTPSSSPPAETGHWQPPPVASTPGDVDRAPLRIDANALVAGAGDPKIVDVGSLACTPVPHAQVRAPVTSVTARESHVAPTVIIRPARPLDLSDIRFAYATIDLCRPRADVSAELLLIVRCTNGSTRTGTARVWPASWNRVAVDLGEWPEATSVSELEVGLRHVHRDGNSLALHPVDPDSLDGFHLGEVGVSALRRTW